MSYPYIIENPSLQKWEWYTKGYKDYHKLRSIYGSKSVYTLDDRYKLDYAKKKGVRNFALVQESWKLSLYLHFTHNSKLVLIN